MTRRRRVDPSKAATAALGGFYSKIEVTRAGWPTCSRCGTRTALVDLESGECLRCKVESRRQAREGSTGTAGPF